HLAAIADQRGYRGRVDDASPAAADHWHDERPGHVEKAVDRDIQHTVPLAGSHPGERRIVVDAGIVDQDLDRPGLQRRLQHPLGLLRVCDVEGQRLGSSTGRSDLRSQLRGGLRLPPGVYEDMMPVLRQPAADCSAELTAASSDERTLRSVVRHRGAKCVVEPPRMSNIIVARPRSSGCSPSNTAKSYSTVVSSEVTRVAVAMRSERRSSRRSTNSRTPRTLAR